MKTWMKVTAATVGAVISGVAAAFAVAGFAWDRQTGRALQRLHEAAALPAPDHYSPAELEGLPDPVVRYFEFALVPGQPIIRRARIEHAGEFRAGLDRPWGPFTSVQDFVVNRPGFVWDARVQMAPLTTVRVRDSYISGRGGMLARVGGLVTVVNEEGTPSLNAGALHRWLLEAAWYPTALLPSQGVRWEAVDDSTARAFIEDGGMTLSMDVHFAADGGIARVEAMRMRDVDGTGVPTPFHARVSDYQRLDGMMIPVAGEVEWILPEGTWTFWRGRLTGAAYWPAP